MDENTVVERVCRSLNRKGWTVVSRCTTSEQGIDIVAEHPSKGWQLHVEAKGGTSSVVGSPKYGKTYKSSGVSHRVGDAVYAATKLFQTRKRATLIALAFPDTAVFREYVGGIQKALDRLQVGVIWVG